MMADQITQQDIVAVSESVEARAKYVSGRFKDYGTAEALRNSWKKILRFLKDDFK